VVLVLTFIAFASVSLLGESALGKVQILLGEAFVLIPALLYSRWRRFPLLQLFRVRRVGWRVMVASVFIALAMTIIADEADRLMNLILPFPETLARMLSEVLIARTWLDWLLIVTGAVLLAGMFEEMLFRGFLQNAFEQETDVTVAILLTSLLFGFIHLNPWWIVQIILLGVILGVMAWKSNSILPGAVVHAINNGISVVMINTNRDSHGLDMLEWHGHIHPVALTLALAVLVVGMRFFYRFCEEESELPTFFNLPLR